MSNCVNTVFSTLNTSSKMDTALVELGNISPALSIPLSIPLAIIKRVIITLQHIARVITFTSFWEKRDLYAQRGCCTAAVFKIINLAQDIISIALAPSFLLIDAGKFFFVSIAQIYKTPLHPSERGLNPE